VVDGGYNSNMVTCVPMSAILAAVGVQHVDFMSVDTEGNEPEIIESIDFNAVQIDYFDVECNDCFYNPEGNNSVGVPICSRQRQLKALLESRGYTELLFIPPVDIIYGRK